MAATGACWDNLITSFPNEHRALTNHHINELTKTREDGLLDYGTPYFSQTALTRGCMFWYARMDMSGNM